MKKTFPMRVTEPRSPKPLPPQDDTAHLVREDFEEQQERFEQEAAVLRTPESTTPAEQPADPATEAAKLIAPLGALWPSSGPEQG